MQVLDKMSEALSERANITKAYNDLLGSKVLSKLSGCSSKGFGISVQLL